MPDLTAPRHEIPATDMSSDAPITKIAYIGDYLPRKCGIATFTHDLCEAITTEYPDTERIVVPVNDLDHGYDYPPEVRFEIEERELNSYSRAADFLNFSNIDVVSLQHEYGIYGGTAGGHILKLLRDLRMPVVTTLHTILQNPNVNEKRVLQQLAELSARLVVMSERGRDFLTSIYEVSAAKIDLIPHGIPDMPFVDSNFFKDQFGVEGKFVVLTFGLLSPNKGIEYVLNALPEVVDKYPNLVYVILGATHPNLVREHGETYRISLERLAQDLKIKKHVVFYNRFVEPSELTQFLGAADIYITPYLNPAQITSGTLAYAFGCGKAVISTPYWHAEELLAEDRGMLVPFGDSGAIAKKLIELLENEPLRLSIRKRAYLLGRDMIWSQAAQQYMASFRQARMSRVGGASGRLAVRTLEEEPLQLPVLRLDHLFQMTDSTGILQHADYSIPNLHEGYCLDDNARALILCVQLEGLGQDTAKLQRAAMTYAAYLNYSFDVSSGRFRNFLDYSRRWLEDSGSDDSVGRATWALGACAGRSRRKVFQSWGVGLFEQALNLVAETSSPRTWAFAILGIHDYFRRFSGDRLVSQWRESLTSRLIALYDQVASNEWQWFESQVSYDNAKLPHALILSGRWGSNSRALELGLCTLRWLAEVQRSDDGHFRPIGSNGFYPRGQAAAEFDQQPLEAQAMVSACIEAYRATDDEYWLGQAQTAFEWFLGRNDLGLAPYDPNTGGVPRWVALRSFESKPGRRVDAGVLASTH